MKNPYKILGLKQDASNSDIVKSQIKALKSKKYTMKEITEAQATLRKPAQRLTCTPKVRQKTFGVLLCLKSTGNMAMQND